MAWDIEIVIPSRGRPMCHKTVALFNDPLICVGEHEVDLYRAAHPTARILPHPVGPQTTLAWVRQFILDSVPQRVVFMCDDDVSAFACLVGQHVRRLGPNETEQVLINSAQNALDAGTAAFAFAHTIDVRNFRPFAPISFTGYANGFASGFIDREFKFDVALTTKSDIDISLQILRDRRILWRDMRFAFESNGWFRRTGGMAGRRTTEVIEQDLATLRERWGNVLEVDHLNHSGGKGKHQSVHINVSR